MLLSKLLEIIRCIVETLLTKYLVGVISELGKSIHIEGEWSLLHDLLACFVLPHSSNVTALAGLQPCQNKLFSRQTCGESDAEWQSPETDL